MGNAHQPGAEPAGLAESLFLLHDPDWRSKVFFGGCLLMVPFIGWPAVLGYRKALIARLFEGTEPVLPPWRGHVRQHIWEGIKAIGVIFAQYSPLYLVFGWLLVSRGANPDPVWLVAPAFFLAFSIFSPLAFPLALVVAAWPGGSGLLMVWEAVALLTGYTAVTFVIPAGFLQVSRTGRYASAFRYWESLPFLVRNFRAYCGAWYRSMVMSLSGHFAVPFSPWGVVWCYLGIIYSFNQVLADELARTGSLAATSWLARLRGADAVVLERGGLVRVVVRPTPADPAVPDVVVRVGPIFVPLPHLVAATVTPRR